MLRQNTDQRFYATNGLDQEKSWLSATFKLDAKAPGAFEVTKIHQPISNTITEGMI
jgi:hypothetical protein